MTSEQSQAIKVTESAKKQILSICQKDETKNVVRLSIRGGGCSGFEYQWETHGNDKIEDDDLIVAIGESVKLVVDMISLGYLHGTEVDFVTEMMGSSFKLNNPNAIGSCGCGESVQF